MRPKTYLLSGVLSLVVLLPVESLHAQADSTQHSIDPEKEAAIRTYLELTRVSEAFIAGLEQGMAAESDAAGMPEGFLEQFQAKAREKLPDFIDMLVPIYDKHMTLEQLNALIEFMRTPLGQELVEIEMKLADEMAAIGERWGMRVAAEVLMDIANEPPK